MPYDKDGKYYRQPVYKKNFIFKKNSEGEPTNKEEADKDELKLLKAKNLSLLRYIWLFLILYLSGMFFFLFLPNFGPRSPSNNLPSNNSPSNNSPSSKKDAPSIEKTLDNMLQYQKEKDARRRQEKIIDKIIDKEMNSW